MELGDLRLLQAVVEVRYSNAYYLWDRSGLLWSDLALKLEGLRMLTVNSNQVVGRLRDSYELAARLDSASVHGFKPNRTLTEFSNFADQFFHALSRVLEIAEYSRVGCRLIYVKDFPNVEDATVAALSSGILRWPEGRHFNISGRPKQPEWALRFDDDSSGVQLRLKIDERNYEFEPPLVWEGASPEKKTSITLTYDVDWYTRAPVLVTQMSYEDWIKQCLHFVNRDSNAFLRGR